MARSMMKRDSEILNCSENVILSWTNYNYLLTSGVQEFYDEETLCDCTLTADGESFDCHKIVLSACSPLFYGLLKDQPTESRPALILDGLSKNELKAIVEFMYTGETSIPHYNLFEFLESCKFLDITGLKEYSLVHNDPADVELKVKPEEYSLMNNDPTDVEIRAKHDLTPFDDHVDCSLTEDDINLIGNDEFLLPESPPPPDENFLGNEESVVCKDEFADDPAAFETEPEPDDEALYTWDGTILSSSDDAKSYQCKKCGNKYAHRRTLLHHLHWICNQPATYACNLCPYMGKRKFQLKSHMTHVHSRSLLKKKRHQTVRDNI